MVNTERLCLGCMNDNGGEQVCPICGFDNSADNSKEQAPGLMLTDTMSARLSKKRAMA